MENVTRVVWIIVIVGLTLVLIEQGPRIVRMADDVHTVVVSIPEWKSLFERAVVAAEKFKVSKWFGEQQGMTDGVTCQCGCGKVGCTCGKEPR